MYSFSRYFRSKAECSEGISFMCLCTLYFLLEVNSWRASITDSCCRRAQDEGINAKYNLWVSVVSTEAQLYCIIITVSEFEVWQSSLRRSVSPEWGCAWSCAGDLNPNCSCMEICIAPFLLQKVRDAFDCIIDCQSHLYLPVSKAWPVLLCP